METKQEQILKIRKKVSESNIFIARIPKKTKVRFQEIAKDEFENDYGMTLKWMLDFREGLLSSPNQIIMEQMEVLASEVASLKSQPEEKEKKKVIRSVSGKPIATKEE